MQQVYTVTIPGISLEHPLLLPISPDQAYHNGPIFKAILQELEQSGVAVIIVIADELRRFNFQIELTKDSEENIEVKNKVEELKESWVAMNLRLDPETQELVKKMQQAGKFTVMHWDDCKAKHREIFESVFQGAHAHYDSSAKTSFHGMVDEAAERFFEAVVDRKKNDSIFNYFLHQKGKAFILEAYKKYIIEECAMIVTWWRAGFDQMAYPTAYHGKGSTSEYVFSAAKFLLEHLDKAELLFQWRDIRITCNQEKSSSKGPSQEMQLKRTIKELKGKTLDAEGQRKKAEAKLKKTEEKLRNTQDEEEKYKGKIASLKDQITILVAQTASTPFWGRTSSGAVSAPALPSVADRELFSCELTPSLKESKLGNI